MLIQRKEHQDEDGSLGYIESIFESSNILKTTYFPKRERLYLSFNKGMTYSYGNVSKDTYEKFENAESQGKFFVNEIKKHPEKFPYRKEFTLYPSEIEGYNNIIQEHKEKNEKK